MNNKKIKNIIFIVIIILIPLIIMLLNNFSYNDENEKANTCLSGGAQENIYIKLKKGRQNKYNDMIIGSSDVSIMFTANKFNLKVISLGNIGIKNYYEIIKAYIDLHPELNHIIIVFSMLPLISDQEYNLPQYTGENFNKKELISLYFSLDTTLENFYKFINGIKFGLMVKQATNNNKENYEVYTGDIFRLEVYPNRNYNESLPSAEQLIEIENSNYYWTKQIIKLLKENNIKFEFVFSPANSIFLALINQNKSYKEAVGKYKRFLVNQNVTVYDMAFANKYTNTDMRNKNQIFYMDFVHPQLLFGEKIYKLFFDKKLDKKDFYFILNKNNVETILKKEDYLIKKYIQNNKDLIDYYQDENLDIEYNYCQYLNYEYNKFHKIISGCTTE